VIAYDLIVANWKKDRLVDPRTRYAPGELRPSS
jgi:hypothetical protein